jgi:lipopolysaccharide export system permease protein
VPRTGLRVPILDRYMLAEFMGPFGFGLFAFTVIFAATQILAIGRLVSDQHAPLWAAVEVFLWNLPGEVVLVIPMAMLLGTLLAVQRLSGESEITAMKAGGIGFMRVVAPLLAGGIVLSLVTFALQEKVVPFASGEVAQIQNDVINHNSAFNQDLITHAPLPGGGRQITIASAFDPNDRALLNVTLLQYDARGNPSYEAFADRARFEADQWLLENVSEYQFSPDGEVYVLPKEPEQKIALYETPTDIVKRMKQNDPQQMSLAQIADIVHTGQLTDNELRKYTTIFQQKIAQPFACFVFVLIAVPFGLRTTRGGGNASLGFGLAVAIVFVYYVVATICSYLGEAFLPLAALWAWMPNIIFTAIGVTRLRRAAAV